MEAAKVLFPRREACCGAGIAYGASLCSDLIIWKDTFTCTVHNSTIYNCQDIETTPVLLTGKSHGQRSLVGCSPWDRTESDMTEWLHFHFSLACIGGGNGNPLQCSCLENPRDGGAWWAAVYGVAQSRTRLKRLSSSSSRNRLRV